MPHVFFNCPYSDWHGGDTSGSDENGTDVFNEASRFCYIDGDRILYEFPADKRPAGQGWFATNGDWWQPYVKRQTLTPGNDYLGQPIECPDQDIGVVRIATADGSLVTDWPLTPARPELAATPTRPSQHFREVLPWEPPDKFNLTDLPEGLIESTPGGGGVFTRPRHSSSDPRTLPGEPALADLPDAQGRWHGVFEQAGVLIPYGTLLNQIWGVSATDGTEVFRTKGWTGYPATLADWHPNHDGYSNPYPWGTNFGDNGLDHSTNRWTVLKKFGDSHIIALREQAWWTADIRSEFGGYNYTRTVDYPSFRTVSPTSAPYDVTGRWKAFWVLALDANFTFSEPGIEGTFAPFGVDAINASTSGRMVGNPNHRNASTGLEDPPAPVSYLAYETLAEALDAFVEDMKTELETVAAIPNFRRLRCYKTQLFREFINVADGSVTISQPISTQQVDAEIQEIVNGASIVEQVVADTLEPFDLVRQEEPNQNFWKPAPRPQDNYAGGGEDANFEFSGKGMFMHAVLDGSTGPPNARTQFSLISCDAGSGQPGAPGGIWVFRGDGAEPTEIEGAVKHVLTTILPPLAPGEKGWENVAKPWSSSTTSCATNGELVIDFPRPRKRGPRWISEQTPADSELGALWDGILEESSYIRAWRPDLDAGTIELVWEVNAHTLAGAPVGGSAAVSPSVGDCPHGGIGTDQYVWAEIRGAWGGSSIVSRWVQIELETGAVVGIYPVEPGANATYREVGDPLIVHNRRRVQITENKIVEFI